MENNMEDMVEDLAAYQDSKHASDTIVEPPAKKAVSSEGAANHGEGEPGSPPPGDEKPAPPPATPALKDEKYTVSGEMARGGMGIILNAHDSTIGRDVAMKVITSWGQDIREFSDRFVKEAQVQGRLEHPNICPVHELGEDEKGRPYFTMKMVYGYSLAEMIEKALKESVQGSHKRLTEILNIFLKICDGIAYAHSKGIIHRDLKPDNIMVGDFGEVYVMDWGLAKVIGEEDDEAHYGLVIDRRDGTGDVMKTMTGSVVGTPVYMPPEQAKGQVGEMDERSDIYSLGALLYELITLDSPFPRGNPWDVISKINSDTPPLPSRCEHTFDLAPELDIIIMKCLEKDKTDRYNTVQELKEDVELFLSGRPIGSMQYSPWQVISKWVARNRMLSASLVTVLAILIVSFAVSYVRISSSEKDAILERDLARQHKSIAVKARDLAETREREAIAAKAEAEAQKKTAEKKELEAKAAQAEAEVQRKAAEKERRDAEISELTSRLNMAMMLEEKKEIGEAVKLYRQIKETLLTRNLDLFPYINLSIWKALYNQGQSVRYLGSLGENSSWGRSVAFSPDGKILAVGEIKSAIKLYDSSTMKLMKTIPGRSSGVSSLVFCLDGTMLAVGYGNGEVIVWNLDDCSKFVAFSDPEIKKGKAHARSVQGLDISPDGTLLASAGDEVVRIWNVKTKTLQTSLWGHRQEVYTVAFSPDGTRLVSGSRDRNVNLWDVKSGNLITILHQHTDRVRKVLFSPDGRWVVSAGNDTVIKLFNLAESRVEYTLKGHRNLVRAMDFSPDGEILVSGGKDNALRFWDVERQVDVAIFKDHRQEVISLDISPDGTRIASTGNQGDTKVWSFDEDAMVATIDLSTSGLKAMSLAFSPDGTRLAVGPWAPKLVPVLLIDLVKERVTERMIMHGSRIAGICFSPDGRLLATGSEDGCLRIIDVEKRDCLAMINVETAEQTNVLSAVFKSVGLMDKGGRQIWKMVWDVAFSPDGSLVATACDDKTVKLWNVKEQRMVYSFPECTSSMYAVKFSPDGRWLAAGSRNRKVYIWDTGSRTLVTTLTGHGSSVWAVDFSPDGQLLATGADDKTIRVWATTEWKCVTVLKGHADTINDIDFHPGGRVLAAVDDGSTIKLWDVRKEECLFSLTEHIHDIDDVAFSPDGTVLASASKDQTVKLWKFGDALKPLELK